MRISIILGLFFTLWVLPGEVASQVYRYIDKNGVVHFTDTPTDTKFSHHQGSWIENKAENSKEVTEAEDNNEEIGLNQKDVISSERKLPRPIEFASPPKVIVIPTTNVYVVPDLAEEIFFCDGWWWRPWRDRWYRSKHYNSGWVYYKGVPSFHAGIPSDWRDDYRNHQWRGRQWDYQQIPHQQVQRNWSRWKDSRHWEQQTWGVKGLKPHPQQQPHPQDRETVQSQRLQPHPQQPSREVQSQRSQPHPQQPSGGVQYQPYQPQDQAAPQRSKP